MIGSSFCRSEAEAEVGGNNEIRKDSAENKSEGSEDEEMEVMSAGGEAPNGESVVDEPWTWPRSIPPRETSEGEAQDRELKVNEQAQNLRVGSLSDGEGETWGFVEEFNLKSSSLADRLPLATPTQPHNMAEAIAQHNEIVGKREVQRNKYTDAYAGLEDGQLEASFASLVPIPASPATTSATTANSDEIFYFASRSTVLREIKQMKEEAKIAGKSHLKQQLLSWKLSS